MDMPQLLPAREVAPDTIAFTSHLPVPGMGVLPDNAFLLRAREPMLIDTGAGPTAEALVDQLAGCLDLEDLRWIWITHTDPDHVGALALLLERAPNARVVTNYLGLGKLGLLGFALPPERAFLVNPGQRLSLGDREVVAVRPPTYDAPETQGLFDPRTRALFAADSFGAVLEAPELDAAALAAERLREGLITWTKVDAPWLHGTEEAVLAEALDGVRALEPSVVLSGHLPPARGLTERLLAHVAQARTSAPFVGPDQAAVEAMAMGA